MLLLSAKTPFVVLPYLGLSGGGKHTTTTRVLFLFPDIRTDIAFSESITYRPTIINTGWANGILFVLFKTADTVHGSVAFDNSEEDLRIMVVLYLIRKRIIDLTRGACIRVIACLSSSHKNSTPRDFYSLDICIKQDSNKSKFSHTHTPSEAFSARVRFQSFNIKWKFF